MKRLFLALLLVLWLVACGDGTSENPSPTPSPNPTPSPSPTPTPNTATLSGKVTVGLNSSTAGFKNASLNSWQPSLNEDFIAGDIIVKYAGGLQAQALSTLSVGQLNVKQERALALEATHLYRNASLSKRNTLEMIKELNKRPDVIYAQPNYLRYAMLEPNDQFYNFQWHYPAINLPETWDITTGDPSTVVAVLDTGILFEEGNAANTHPDFVGKVLPGFDFITNTQIANDGDGRDSNAFDPSDNPGDQGSYHGSHVAGTIAAATNNTNGVAGVNWQAKILPVRVLGAAITLPTGGKTSGSLADIIDGILWSAGLSVAGVPQNLNPASILNLSLGGGGTCPPAEQDAFDQAIAAGAIPIVAAGNENKNANQFAPASCSGVITVGATDFAGARAPYSNFGSRIDVVAPGGDVTANLNNDFLPNGNPAPDGVLSLTKIDSTNSFSFNFLQGTSMAAPHVAGVVSLMKAQNPNLTAPQALSILRATARPLSSSQCNGSSQIALSASDCGAGLIDALAAVQNANTVPPPAAGQGSLVFTPNPIDFGTDKTELFLEIKNTSDVAVSWEITEFNASSDNPDPLPDGTLFAPNGASSSGTIAAGQTDITTIGLNRSLLENNQTGSYQLLLSITSNSVTQELPVRFTLASSEPTALTGGMLVASLIEDSQGRLQISCADSELPSGCGYVENAGVFTDYSFTALPGDNAVLAWIDENNNLDIDSGDFVGVYPDVIKVEAGVNQASLDFSVSPFIATTLSPDIKQAAESYLQNLLKD